MPLHQLYQMMAEQPLVNYHVNDTPELLEHNKACRDTENQVMVSELSSMTKQSLELLQDLHLTTFHLLIALCEGLTTSNPRGGESLAGAAESWNISEDGRIYTFNLQKNGRSVSQDLNQLVIHFLSN